MLIVCPADFGICPVPERDHAAPRRQKSDGTVEISGGVEKSHNWRRGGFESSLEVKCLWFLSIPLKRSSGNGLVGFSIAIQISEVSLGHVRNRHQVGGDS
jgi:hypothetical protein